MVSLAGAGSWLAVGRPPGTVLADGVAASFPTAFPLAFGGAGQVSHPSLTLF